MLLRTAGRARLLDRQVGELLRVVAMHHVVFSSRMVAETAVTLEPTELPSGDADMGFVYLRVTDLPTHLPTQCPQTGRSQNTHTSPIDGAPTSMTTAHVERGAEGGCVFRPRALPVYGATPALWRQAFGHERSATRVVCPTDEPQAYPASAAETRSSRHVRRGCDVPLGADGRR